MTWTPTEGMRRADAIVGQYADDMAASVHFIVPQIMRSRLFDIVATAIDQALADGSTTGQKALAEKVVNGIGPNLAPTVTWTAKEQGFGEASSHMRVGDDVTVVGGPHAGSYRLASPDMPAPKKRGPKKGSKRKPKAKAAETTGDAP